METKTETITFDEGGALFDVLDMLTDMLKEATRDYDHAIEDTYQAAMNPSDTARIKEAIDYQNRMAERVNALGQARDRAQYIFNGMILEAAQVSITPLTYFD